MIQGSTPQVPPASDAAVIAWMGAQGWKVGPARWEVDPEPGFHVWQENGGLARISRALWISDPMIRRLKPEQLIGVLDKEEMAQEIRISIKIRIEERGAEYRVSVVPRRSGEWPTQGGPG
ncbi:MAG: hypothetical protein ABI703_07500 [Gemmatimonadales bacterium]